jgi:hypothetical protein
MVFGSLALQVVSVRAPVTIASDTVITYDTSEAPWGEGLLQIWPPSPATWEWPPAMGLRGDLGIEALIARFSSQE